MHGRTGDPISAVFVIDGRCGKHILVSMAHSVLVSAQQW